MRKYVQVFVVVCVSLSLVASDLYARGGGRGGGGGGGGGARAGGGGGGARTSAPSRSPSVSRPSNMGASPASRPSASPSKPAARPSTGQAASRPSVPSSGARPATGGAATRPAAGAAASRPGTNAGARPATGAIGGGNASARPSTGQLNDFLDMKPSTGAGAGRNTGTLGAVAGGVAGGMAGGAAADFLKDSGARATATPRTGAAAAGAVARPGEAARAATGAAATQRASTRPQRIENRDQMQSNRSDRRDEIQKELNDTPIRDFWQDNPGWAAFRMTAPYRWASWGAVSGWVGYGATESYPYSYGENVYYQDGSVYYDDKPVATAEEYATQAQDIVESAPEVPPDQAEWMPLGVFALTQDGEASGPKPTLYVQLAISKQGVIGGTLRNDTADTTQELEGMADKDSQRVAWTVVGQSRPIMETGIANLTEETTPVLVHFAEGETQQWLMVHLKDPQSQETK